MLSCVPVKEAISVAANRLYSGEVETPPVSKNTYITLLELSATNVVMSTYEGYFCQRDGLAMGSPPLPPPPPPPPRSAVSKPLAIQAAASHKI